MSHWSNPKPVGHTYGTYTQKTYQCLAHKVKITTFANERLTDNARKQQFRILNFLTKSHRPFMKHLLLLLSTLCCTLAFAQAPKAHFPLMPKHAPQVLKAEAPALLCDSMVTYQNDARLFKNSYTYDKKGNKIGDTLYERLGDKWLEQQRTDFVYDEDGKLMSYTTEQWENNQWNTNGKSEYVYNADGNVLSATAYTWNGSSWIESTRYTYDYDQSGFAIRQEFAFCMEGLWIPYQKSDFTNDTEGQRIAATEYMWDGYEWTPWKQWEYTYDTNGNKITDTGYAMEDEEWVKNDLWQYTYDENGNMTLEVSYEWYDETPMGSSKWEYTYDENGYKIREDYAYGTDNVWYPYGYYLYYYSDPKTSDIKVQTVVATPGSRKVYKDGTVLITTPNKTFNLNGISTK